MSEELNEIEEVKPVKPRSRKTRTVEVADEPEHISLMTGHDDADDYEIIQLVDSEEIPPPGQGFGVNGRQFLLRANVWYKVPKWLLSTIDNCIVERPVTDDKGRLAGFRPMKRFPYDVWRG